MLHSGHGAEQLSKSIFLVSLTSTLLIDLGAYTYACRTSYMYGSMYVEPQDLRDTDSEGPLEPVFFSTLIFQMRKLKSSGVKCLAMFVSILIPCVSLCVSSCVINRRKEVKSNAFYRKLRVEKNIGNWEKNSI